MHRIVIVGGGAGGLALATRLGNSGARGRRMPMQVTLVDRNPTHVWKPLLHEVAAGSMDHFAHQLEYAAQARWNGFKFQLGELRGLDRHARTVTIGAVLDGSGVEILPARQLPYDTLVLSVGSVTNYFGVEGAEEFAIALDSPSDAERFRQRLISVCTRVQRSQPAAAPDDVRNVLASTAANGPARRAPVSIVIVGAGATGVELSAELRETAETFAAYGLEIDPRKDVSITIVEGGERILPALPERVSEQTRVLLDAMGVQIMTGEVVSCVTAAELRTKGGKTLPSDLTVWAAGIKAPPVLAGLDNLPTNRAGQLVVSETLQVEGDEHIYAFGDCACCPWASHGRNVPPRAQAAHQQATFLASAIPHRLRGGAARKFRYRDLGSLVSLGRLSAVGNLMGGVIGRSMLVEGLLARFMYMSLYRLHIVQLHGWRRMMIDTVAHALRRATRPRVKLH